ncbi:hypothetical protein BJF78_22415 [Pseudonocardia sp. CNS-139]|nr:hypothetical protein BJF78_22415 [Pseudonocardia sp. CNS-139]
MTSADPRPSAPSPAPPTFPVRKPAWNETRVLVIVALALAVLDSAIHLAGPPTTGWAGIPVLLVVGLVLDGAVPFLPRCPRVVAGLAMLAVAAIAVSEMVSPGLLIPAEPITQVRIPTAVTLIVWYQVRYRDHGTSLAVVSVLTVLGAQLWSPTWDVTPTGLLGTLVPALLALYFRSRSELLQSLRDRAERSEREARLLAEHARHEERRRLATEMHDVVSHRISLIVLQAGALGVKSPSAEVRDAVEDIRTTGIQALEELREVVGVLRGDIAGDITEKRRVSGGGRRRPADLDLATLVAESQAVGVPVELRVEGDLDGDGAAAVPVPVQRTVYRVVQEGLTNVRKHAPGADVRVTLTCTQTGVEVLVQDTGTTSETHAVLADSGSGVGLAGLRQRVESFGGTLDSGPFDGGFRLRAVLPAGNRQ